MLRIIAHSGLCLSLCGCALVAPDFDIPTDKRGVQRTRSIVERIRCELAELIKSDFPLKESLIFNDYQFAASIYLDISNKAGLNPAFSFPDTVKYVFDIGGRLDQSRQDSITINIAFSMRNLENDIKEFPEIGVCPALDNNLAGDLGLKRRVEMAMSTPYFERSTSATPTTGEFSGTIQFISTYAITSAGPTWTFRDFQGPGQFASASSIYTDKLTYAFAAGKYAGKFLGGVPLARRLIVEQNQNDALAQISGLRNAFR